jgi:hypothetical protein
MTQTATRTPLTAEDRCDRCGAAAMVRVQLSGGTDLLFCSHHFREHEVRLREVAIEVLDQTQEPDRSIDIDL